MTSQRAALVFAACIAALNFYFCREFFWTEYFNNLQSNEGALMALARFFRDHPGERWFPYWNTGIPLENTYSPLLPKLGALLSSIPGVSPARAIHILGGFFFCLGPLAWFFVAWKWTGRATCAFVAVIAYSLVSPTTLLFADLSTDMASRLDGRRIMNVLYYGDYAHLTALSLLPLALFCIERAIRTRRAGYTVAAVALGAVTALANAFGATILALGSIAIVASIERKLLREAVVCVAAIGVAVYLLICPFLTPAVLKAITANELVTSSAVERLAGAAIVLAGIVAIRFAMRHGSFGERFPLILAWALSGILVVWFVLKIAILPQPHRYHIDADVALCIAATALLWKLPVRARWTVVALGLLLAIPQAIRFRRFARELAKPVQIEDTGEYKTTQWVDQNLHGVRTMMSGSTLFWLNDFSDSPQMSGGHDPFAPNFMLRVAVFTLYSGQNAGERDAEYSIFWLKAFGAQAVHVPGSASKQHYRPYWNPAKFEGVLPVLWREQGDTIYAVPAPSKSVARVIRASSVVARQPVHGLDVEPAAAYVRDLDDETLPKADLEWLTPSRARIHTNLAEGHKISVQTTYDSGWIAYSGTQRHTVTGDALGQIVIDPSCRGACEMILEFEGGPARKAYSAASAGTAVLLLAWAVRRRLSK